MRFISDAEVALEIIRLIDGAKQGLLLICPYFLPWKHLERALAAAVARGVSVNIVVRTDPGKSEDLKQVDAVRGMGISGIGVRGLPWLHSKIYLSETSAIMSSMNLHSSSSAHSMEVGYVLDESSDRSEYSKIRAYAQKVISTKPTVYEVTGTLPARSASASRKSAEPKTVTTNVRKGSVTVTTHTTRGKAEMGYCIRCADEIPRDIDRPLCGTCFAVWRRYSDPGYIENFCHGCEEEMDSSVNKPFCRPCYAEER